MSYYQNTRVFGKKVVRIRRGRFLFGFAATTAVITGTIISGSPTEADVVDGTAGTIIINLIGDTWKAAGTGPIGTTTESEALLAGIDGDVAGGTGWDAEVRDNFVTGDISRDSNTQCTITVGAEAGYDIFSTETITVTVPTDVLVTGAAEIIAAPTFGITAVSAAAQLTAGSLMMMGVGI